MLGEIAPLNSRPAWIPASHASHASRSCSFRFFFPFFREALVASCRPQEVSHAYEVLADPIQREAKGKCVNAVQRGRL